MGSELPCNEERKILNSNQTPIEHIVSRTDLELFEKSKRKAEELTVRFIVTLFYWSGLKLFCLFSIQIDFFNLSFNKLILLIATRK